MPIANEIFGEVNGVRNYLNALSAIDSGLRFQIHQAMVAGPLVAPIPAPWPLPPGQLPDYTNVPPSMVAPLEGLVDAAYNPANRLHPFHGVMNAAAVGHNHFNEGLLRDIVLGYAREAKTAIRSGIRDHNATWPDAIAALGDRARQDLSQRLWQVAGEHAVTATPDTLPVLTAYLNTTYPGINATVMGLVTDKAQLAGAFALDVAAKMGARITANQIEDAIYRGTR